MTLTWLCWTAVVVRRRPTRSRGGCVEAWLDIIFSQREEDLPELVSEYPLSAALRELTPQQREILRLNLVFDIPAREIAERAGCTTRNITKLRQKALEKLRDLVGGGQPETTLPKTG